MTDAVAEDPRYRPDPPSHILVVEDDPALRETICWALEDEGLSPRGVADGQEALDVLLEHQPSLVILDWNLPVVSSETVAERVRAAYGGTVPILLVTADGRAARKAERLGAQAYLHKPFDLDDLIEVVHRVISPGSARG
jgi:DNA-binding response OmpR family regulator